MQFRYGLVVAWILATLTSILVAFAAVGSVRTTIADPPSALLLPAADDPDRLLPEAQATQPSSVPDPEVADGAPGAAAPSAPTIAAESGATVEPGRTTTSTQPVQPPETPPTTPAQSTTTTTAATTTTLGTATTVTDPESLDTYETEGGWVTVRSSENGAFLEAASPKPGWTAETEGQGPEHFTVVFKSEGDEIHFKVEFEDGRVEVDIER